MHLLRRIIIIVLLCSVAIASLSLSFHNFNFEPQYSDQLGFSFNSTYSQALSPSNAFLLEGDYGNNQYRLGLTFGQQLTLTQRIKLTFEHLAERIGYNFDSGTVNQWSGQNAAGGDYQILLSNSHLNAFDISGYYAKADSDQLAPVIFSNNTLINYRNIAGATSEGAGAGLNFSLWKNSLLNTTVNYDDMVYHTIYQNAPNASGLGETVSLEQLINPVIKVKLLQSHRQIYDQYEAGLNWLLPARPTTQLQLGVDLAHFDSHTALGDENRIGLKLSYSWDLPSNTNNFYAPPSSSTQDLTTWTNEPAVHMQQVLTTVDQKTVAVPQQPPLLAAAPFGLKQNLAPKIITQMGPQTFAVNDQVNITLHKNQLFYNPLPNNFMTLSVSGLPSNLQANPPNDVNLISGTPNQNNVNHGPYTITITAYNGPNMTPHDPSYETSQTFTLTITPSNGPVYNGPAQLPSGSINATYPTYNLQAQFTPATTQVIVDASSLPPGLIFSNGQISGTPTATGTFPLTVSATNNGVTITPKISIDIHASVQPPIYNGPPQLAQATTTAQYSVNFAQYFLGSNVQITVDNLPPGLTFNSANGTISGTPAQAGTFALTVTAKNSTGTINPPVSIVVVPAPTYSGAQLPAGVVNTPYQTYNLQAQFSPSTTQLTVDASSLPPGLTFSNGEISGTPTTTGTFNLHVTAKNGDVTITPAIKIIINSTAVGHLACPDPNQNSGGMQSNDGVQTYYFNDPNNPKIKSIAGSKWLASHLNGNTFSCDYQFNAFAKATIQTTVDNATGDTTCNSSLNSCLATITYG